MTDGETDGSHDGEEPEWMDAWKRALELTRRYNELPFEAHERRRDLLEELLGSVGDACFIVPPFRCDYGHNIHIGDRLFANFDCVVLDAARVSIGDDCLFGPGVHVYAATHSLDASERADEWERGTPVRIGDDVWIGGRAVINPGVTVGDGSVVAAGAVVTEDVPEGVLVQGNPATVVKELD